MQNHEIQEIRQFHLINENAELQNGFDEHIKDYKFGKDYAIVSIIGSQSSGKSTLLNRMFGTTFEVLNQQVERRQVTKGIWLAGGVKKNLIVLDVEGSDSRERWDERHFFEQSTALFALALSQILIINLWTHEVGRFSGSQYGILKVIFEMNIKLFGQDQMKQLVFILRDYSEMENFEEIQELINKDIQRIWEEISKPEQFAKKKPEELFKIAFFKLSHIRYAKEEFEAGVEHLKQMFFNKEEPDYILKSFAFENNLLLSDVPLFAKQIWETIKSNKDLNLPSEKIMIANMRCNQIQQESLELIANDLNAFHKTNSSKVIYEQFGENGKQIIQKALQCYDENSGSYQQEVRDEKRIELENQLLSKFYVEFEQQRKKINSTLLNQYIKQVEALQLDRGEMQDIIQKLNDTRKIQIDQFQEQINKSIIIENVWDINESVSDIEDVLLQQQNTFVDRFLNFFLSKKDKELKKEIEKVYFQNQINKINYRLFLLIFPNQVQSFGPILKPHAVKFQRLMKTKFFKLSNVFFSLIPLRNLILEGFKFDETISNEKFRNFKSTFGASIQSEIRRRCADLHYYSLKKFKTMFSRKENGSAVNWRLIQEEEIEIKFTNCKQKMLDQLNLFQYYDMDMAEFIGNESKQLETVGARLIEEDQFNLLVQKFNEDIDQEYKDAIEKHNQQSQNSIPKWMWVLLVYFMYDEVLAWLTHSWFFYPLLILIILIGGSFITGIFLFLMIIILYSGQREIPLKILSYFTGLIAQQFGPQLFKLGLKVGVN